MVNHLSGGLFNSSEGHSIELFRYEVDSLFHIRSVSGPLMISPNDIVLINKDQFYVTNDHGSSSGLMQTLEEYLQLRRCNALFYDGKKFSVAASGLGFLTELISIVMGHYCMLQKQSENNFPSSPEIRIQTIWN